MLYFLIFFHSLSINPDSILHDVVMIKCQITLNRRIMSKTVEIQIEKSRSLVEGLRRHVKEMGERGVTNEEINAMEQSVKELEAVNSEVDSIREQLTPTVAKLKLVMDRVKEAYTEKKKTLKGYYPQERWMDYGVPDKR